MNQKDCLPRVADLWGLIGALHEQPEYRPLVDLAGRAQRAQSCAADISLALTCCETAAEIGLAGGIASSLQLNAVQHSLVAHAVILYARATSTHSDGGERGSVSIEDRLTEGQLTDHRILIDLRNRVIAHVHAGEAIGDSVWHREKMILREDGEAWLPGCVTRRIQVEPATQHRLERLLPVAERLIRQTFHKRINRVAEALTRMEIDQKLIEDHAFDPVKFFGNVTAAADALAPAPGQSAMGIAG